MDIEEARRIVVAAFQCVADDYSAFRAGPVMLSMTPWEIGADSLSLVEAFTEVEHATGVMMEWDVQAATLEELAARLVEAVESEQVPE